MAIHYDPKLKRFRDNSGRIVSKARAQRSSVARREYAAAQQKPRKVSPAKLPPSKPKTAPKKVSPAKPAPSKPKAKRPPKPKPKPSTRDVPPWEKEGVVREYPAPDEWFPEVDFYGYDDLIDDWGDYDDEDTNS